MTSHQLSPRQRPTQAAGPACRGQGGYGVFINAAAPSRTATVSPALVKVSAVASAFIEDQKNGPQS
jgi:hypothetical protein